MFTQLQNNFSTQEFYTIYMNRRKKKDRRQFNICVLTDTSERRRELDRRHGELDVREMQVNKDTFDLIFRNYLSDADKNTQ